MTFLGEANLHLKKKYWPPKILRILRQDQGLGSPKKHKVNTQDPSNFFITTQDQQGLASGIFKQQKVGLWFIFPALWSVPPTNFQTGFQNFPPKKNNSWSKRMKPSWKSYKIPKWPRWWRGSLHLTPHRIGSKNETQGSFATQNWWPPKFTKKTQRLAILASFSCYKIMGETNLTILVNLESVSFGSPTKIMSSSRNWITWVLLNH